MRTPLDPRAAALVVEHQLDVASPAAIVWEVVTDLPRYGEWNEFVPWCRSTLVPGEPIAMGVRLLGFVQPQRETVFEHVPGRRFSYGLDGAALGLLASQRSHEVEPLGPARARYRSRFVLAGGLAPVVRALLGARLRAGFERMSLGVVRRAERLAAERAGDAPA